MKGKLFRSALLASGAALLITSGGLISSCEFGTTTNESSGHVEKDVQAYATVQGVVLDDTGAPVSGAKVVVGNKETTTNDAGQYVIEKVPVTAILTDLGQNPSYRKIEITIKAPEGSDLADAVIVTAQPVAQHMDSAADESGVTNPNTVISNNLLAQAKQAVLPHKAATIKAVLRMAGTEEPIKNAIVKLTATTITNCATGCQVQMDPVVVTTDDNGTFEASGLLTSTHYNIEVSGYNVYPNDVTTSTYQGAGKNYVKVVGKILAQPITMADTQPPKIVANPARINGVIGFLGNPFGDGLLVLAPGVDGKNNPIPVMFNETMDTTGALTPNESVVVYDTTAKQIVSVANLAWDTDGKTLLISTDTALPEGHDIYVRLRGYEFKDLAGNALPTGPVNAVISTTSVSDPFVDTSIGNKKDYVGIQYEVYHSTTAVVDPVTDLVQLDVPGADSNTADDDPTPFYAVSNTFENYKGFYDVDEKDDSVIWQLNDPSITDTISDNLICQLAKALNSNIDPVNCIANSVTKVAFTPVSGVTKYKVKYNGSDLGTIDMDNPNFGTEYHSFGSVEARLSGGKIEIRLTNVNVGDVIDVVSLNGFGDEATAASVKLEDTVPAFTIVQNTPVTPNVDIIGGSTGGGTSDSLVDIGSAVGGTGLPIFYARADMYSKTASKIGNWDQLDGNDAFYNESNFSSFISPSRTLGVWFSEPLNTVTAKFLEGTTDKTSSLLDGSPFYVGTVDGYPLAAFKIKNIVELQNLTRISFAGSTDNQGNVSGSEADLVVRDKMPPMVKKAYVDTTDPTKFVVEFTEDISLTDKNGGNPIGVTNFINIGGFSFNTDSNGDVIGFSVPSYTDQYGKTLDPTKTTVTATVTGNKLEIQVTGKDSGDDNVDTSKFWEELVWALDKDTNGDYYTVNGAINFNNVPDVHGNDWSHNSDNMGTPPIFVAQDNQHPRIASTLGVQINNATNPLVLDIVNDSGIAHNMITTVANDNIWVVGDDAGTNGSEDYYIKIKLREPLADTNNDGTIDANDVTGIDFSMSLGSGSTATYLIPATNKIQVIDSKTIQVHFILNSGKVAKGDSITITGIQDDAGNAMPDITIKLNAAGEGVTVSPANAY